MILFTIFPAVENSDQEEDKDMKLINFLLWLITGALFGWFASRMVEAEGRQLQKVNLSIHDSE
jgi:hypothetical protein